MQIGSNISTPNGTMTPAVIENGPGVSSLVAINSPSSIEPSIRTSGSHASDWRSIKNRAPLGDRVAKAAEGALAARHFVSTIDIFTGIGWLDAGAVERWRRGQIDCLEEVVQSNLPAS